MPGPQGDRRGTTFSSRSEAGNRELLSGNREKLSWRKGVRSPATLPVRPRTLAALPLLLFLLAAGPPVNPEAAFARSAAVGHATPLECDVPIRWYIAEVDEQFGLSVEEAARAVRAAGLLWQEAVGHQLLFQESDSGMGIRFVYDERQDRTRERRTLEETAEELAAEVAAAGAELAEARQTLDDRRLGYETRSAAFRDRLTAHNREVDEWNQEGGVPSEELSRVRTRGEELEREREALNEEVAALNRLTAHVNEEVAALNRTVAEHDRLVDELEARFGSEEEEIESGRYRETRRAIGGWVFSVFREIRIFQFEDADHLVLVLAHEMGHALGLEHSEVPGSVMADSAEARPGAGPPRLHRSDIAQVRDICFPLLGAQ